MVDTGPPLAQGAIPSNNTFRLVLYDALASEAMGTFTACVFLAGFVVELEDLEAIMAWEPELTPREPCPLSAPLNGKDWQAMSLGT